jgi:2,5-diketo-D-gluconate reductase A
MDIHATRTLRTGNKIPVLGLGTWQLARDTAEVVETAIKHGYPMIDTSGDYGTQPGVGEGIRRSGIRRDEIYIYIVTKVEETDDAYEATKADLRELGLDYADLMLIHRPPARGSGEALWRGLMRARDEGLTRDIGVSNYRIDQIEALLEATGEVPVVNQIEWTPFGHSEDMFDYTNERGIIIQAYSPLSRATRLHDRLLTAIADKHGKTPAQVLIRWDLQLGTVPLPKANHVDHLDQNLDVFDFSLTDDDMEALSAMNQNYSALGARLKYA